MKADHRILNVVVTPEDTRIDFSFTAPPEYDDGGWVQIAGDSFIRPAGTESILPMIRAEGIALAPEKIRPCECH